MSETDPPEEFTVREMMYRNDAIKELIDKATPPNDVTVQLRSIEFVRSSDVYEDDDGLRVKDFTFKLEWDTVD